MSPYINFNNISLFFVYYYIFTYLCCSFIYIHIKIGYLNNFLFIYFILGLPKKWRAAVLMIRMNYLFLCGEKKLYSMIKKVKEADTI